MLPLNATLESSGPGELTLRLPQGHIRWRALPATVKTALERLADGGATEEELAASVSAADGTPSLARLYYCVAQLRRNGLLWYSVRRGGEDFATLVPMTARYVWPEPAAEAAQPYVLSRFAFLRRREGRMTLETPLSEARVLLYGGAAAGLVARLMEPATAAGLARLEPSVSTAEALDFLSLLLAAGALCPVGADGATPEEENRVLEQWEFHDLLFHTRTRLGRCDRVFGGSFPFKDRIPPLPAVKPPMSERFVPLYRPDPARLAEGDPPLARAMEERRSIRAHGEQPPTLQQLGEFLFRCARVRMHLAADPEHGWFYDATSRPYPNGGACYELELYLTVRRCEGLDPGLYHYDPQAHRLEVLRGWDDATAALLGQHAWALQNADGPHIAIHVAARFQRVSWKYRSMAYALILKHVGVLYQSMYLAGTAMGLATLGIGGGHADLLNEITGLDYHAESVVGEFLIGGR